MVYWGVGAFKTIGAPVRPRTAVRCRLAVSGRLAVEKRRGRYGANVTTGRHFVVRVVESDSGRGRWRTNCSACVGAPSVACHVARGPSSAGLRPSNAEGLEDEVRWCGTVRGGAGQCGRLPVVGDRPLCCGGCRAVLSRLQSGTVAVAEWRHHPPSLTTVSTPHSRGAIRI